VSIFPSPPQWSKSYSRCPLSNRGWTLQERELSVRSVFYTGTQILWECQSGHATERLPAMRRPEGQQTLLFPAALDQQTNFSNWYSMVESYTTRRLSFQSDRLPAISGLAEAFEQATGITGYAAGLWQQDLLNGLLWSVGGKYMRSNLGEHPIDRLHPRSPTWSWASVDDPVKWWTRHLVKDWSTPNAMKTKPLIKGLEIVPSGSDSRGRITTARLAINGVLRRIVKGTRTTDDNLPDSSVLYALSVEEFCLSGPTWGDINHEYDHPVLEILEYGLCVLVVYLGTRLEYPKQIRNSFGLVLIGTGEENTYRRVGLATTLQPEDYISLERQTIVLV
jgi:hypothetical protein